MGDFNMPSINWAEESKPNGESIEAISGEILQEHMEKQFLCNMIKSPTRGSNILDLIFTNSDDILSEIDNIVMSDMSDHNLIVGNVNYCFELSEQVTYENHYLTDLTKYNTDDATTDQ